MRANYFILLLLWLGGQQYSYGQFHTARIQATGLTCALCSKAIYESLEKLSPVEKVTADIKSSTFSIQFKKEAAVNPDELKAAVEDAGFFVGGLELEGEWPTGLPNSSTPFQLGGNWYQVLSGKANKGKSSFTISVIDKGFVTAKAYKKFLSQFSGPTFSTGYFGADGSSPDQKQRLIHVLIIK